MKSLILILSLVIITACSSDPKQKEGLVDKKTVGILPTEKQSDLIQVAAFKGAQVTGVTVTNDGRMFASFPRWRDNIPYSVIEVMPDGTHRPYPNQEWNTWSGKPERYHYTSVQAVFAQGEFLYVLDPGSPEMKGVVGNARLFRFYLKNGELDKSWTFSSDVAPEKSYLNDFRVDNKDKKIFITDSGLGGLIVLDMHTGEAKRLLDKHPSTKSENVTLTIDKREFKQRIHSDGIALSPVDDKLYYHALTGYTLYRVPSDALDIDLRDETNLVKKVEKLGVTPAPDGMIFDNAGNLYMADLERNAISYRTPDGDIKILIQDERIKWPDTFTIDKNNNLIFTDSLVQATELGKPVDDMTFRIYRVALPRQAQEE